MKPECVLFDFDGVIADTEESNADYLARALAVFGITMTEKERAGMVGINSHKNVEKLLARAQRPVSPEELLEERRRQGNTYENSPTLAAMPGLVDFLKWQRECGRKTGLVSSSSARLILAALNRLALTGLLDVIICGDMVQAHKPSPEGYLKAMELLSVRPQDCVVIEDSPVGIRAGRSAGATVVAYKGARVAQDTSQADFEVGSFAECMSLLIFT